jgi:hypothetical protein
VTAAGQGVLRGVYGFVARSTLKVKRGSAQDGVDEDTWLSNLRDSSIFFHILFFRHSIGILIGGQIANHFAPIFHHGRI